MPDGASAPCLNIVTITWLSSKNNFFYKFHLDTSRLILLQLLTTYFSLEYGEKVQNAFAIINKHMKSSIRGLCSFYGHFLGMGHHLLPCKLSIRPEILGVVLGMLLKHKSRRVSDFFGHIYTTCNFTSLFSPVASLKTTSRNFFIILCERGEFSSKKRRQTRFLDDNHVFVAMVTISVFNLSLLIPIVSSLEGRWER